MSAPDEVGLDLRLEKGGPLFEYTCSAFPREGEGKVSGSVIARIKPVNTMSSTFTIELNESMGMQDISAANRKWKSSKAASPTPSARNLISNKENRSNQAARC